MGRILKYKKFILCSLVLGGLLVGSTVLAALVNWPPSPMGREMDATKELHELIAYIYEWGIALGGLAAFVALLIAGFLYLTSIGDPARMNEAKNRAGWAIGGLALLLASWLILHTINPALTTLQPLILNLEDYVSCKTDDECKERFGEHYKCEKERCVLDEEEFIAAFTPESCEALKVWAVSGAGKEFNVTLGPDEREPIGWIVWPSADFIEEGDPYYIQPVFKEGAKKCTAYLDTYEGRWDKRCAGDRHTEPITVVRHELDEEAEIIERRAETRIKCVGHRPPPSPF